MKHYTNTASDVGLSEYIQQGNTPIHPSKLYVTFNERIGRNVQKYPIYATSFFWNYNESSAHSWYGSYASVDLQEKQELLVLAIWALTKTSPISPICVLSYVPPPHLLQVTRFQSGDRPHPFLLLSQELVL